MRIRGSYRQTFTTGSVTLIAAGTATAGHLFALRNKDTDVRAVLRALEVEFILTTAFGSAQEVGFDVLIARDYTAPHTGGTALTLGNDDGKRSRESASTVLAGRISSTAALTAGTHTLDANPIARGSMWSGAVGDMLTTRRYDFGDEGITLAHCEGIVVRNTVLMGAAGVGKWHFTAEWREVRA